LADYGNTDFVTISLAGHGGCQDSACASSDYQYLFCSFFTPFSYYE